MTTNAETTTNETAANAAEQGAPLAPEKAPSKEGASQKKGAPKGQKDATAAAEPTTPFDGPQPTVKAKAAKTPAKAKASKKTSPAKKAAKGEKAKVSEERSNKKAEVIAMMKRAKGATLSEIMEATGWQAHTCRGFISLLGSKHGQKIESFKNAVNERTYRIAK
jgi:hypothetical protein